MNRKLYIYIASAIVCMMAAFSCGQAFAQSSGEDYFLQGNSLYNQKKYAEAVASYQHAIQAQPIGVPKAYLNCARAYSMQKNYVAAAQYYTFYTQVDAAGANDKKVKAENKDAQKRAGNQSYTRDSSQTTVLRQLNQALGTGPCWDRKGNGALAFYDILIRTGYAEPDLYDIQKKLSECIAREIESDITPADGQPMPALDRTGWEYIRSKLAHLRRFADVPPDNSRINAIDATAQGWDAYYRGAYQDALEQFNIAAHSSPAIVAAHWGKLLVALQNGDKGIINLIDSTEKIYQNAGIGHTDIYFALLRAQAWRDLGDVDKAMMWLDKINGAM